VTSLAGDDWVEVQTGDTEGPRFQVPVDHKVGISFLKHVRVYIDPADPKRLRMGGLFQMWLWPIGLTAATLVLLIGAVGVGTIGRGHTAEAAVSDGGWHLTAPPPALDTDIRVYRPKSESVVPLFWSLLGATMLALGVFLPGGMRIQNMTLGAVGALFMLLMWGLALDSKTTEVSADSSGLRKASAFGWRQVRWDQVGSVEKQHVVFGRDKSLIMRGRMDYFPGRDVTLVAFNDRSGHMLVSMSTNMQPPKQMQRLLDLCAQRTGLHLKFRTLYERNL
jgi:hypothetical protein